MGAGRRGGVTMPVQAGDLRDFYEEAYTADTDAERHGRWRAMSAVAKADHIVELAGAIGLSSPGVVAEIGCGDGSVLAELGRRGFGGRRIGFELSEAAVGMAGQRPEIAEATAFDGAHLPAADGAYDLAFATHVLEHVPSPAPLLREMMRVAAAVIVEVPLERNLSARRPAARAASRAAGHLQRFDRAAVRRLVTDAGWRVRADLVDPLGLDVHLFERDTLPAKGKGLAKWAVRRALTLRPEVGTRLFTVHYALVATPGVARGRSG
jgi:SAM-dependent methyltransferase